jgi:hypothetical protein
MEGIVFEEGTDMEVSRLFLSRWAWPAAPTLPKDGGCHGNGSAAGLTIWPPAFPAFFRRRLQPAHVSGAVAVSQGCACRNAGFTNFSDPSTKNETIQISLL